MSKKLILWLMTTSLYKYLLKHVIPYIRFTTYYTSLRGAKYHEGYAHLKPGHIILTNDKKKLTSLLIPGDWSHAALCVSKGPKYLIEPFKSALKVQVQHPFEIAEMTHTDYTRSYFFDLCKEADRVRIIECVDWDEEHIERVVSACLTFQNAKYDDDFTLGIEALYCSELVYQADRIATDRHQRPGLIGPTRLQVNLEDLAGLGRPYISPDGLARAKNVRVVWDSDHK